MKVERPHATNFSTESTRKRFFDIFLLFLSTGSDPMEEMSCLLKKLFQNNSVKTEMLISLATCGKTILHL